MASIATSSYHGGLRLQVEDDIGGSGEDAFASRQTLYCVTHGRVNPVEDDDERDTMMILAAGQKRPADDSHQLFENVVLQPAPPLRKPTFRMHRPTPIRTNATPVVLEEFDDNETVPQTRNEHQPPSAPRNASGKTRHHYFFSSPRSVMETRSEPNSNARSL